jgi:hypothetical protein
LLKRNFTRKNIQTEKKLEDLLATDELIFFKKTVKKHKFSMDIYDEDKYEQMV